MTELDALLVGAEELENLGTRYLAAVLREDGYTVELAAFSTAEEQAAVVRAGPARPAAAYRAVDHLPVPGAGVPGAGRGTAPQPCPQAHITTGRPLRQLSPHASCCAISRRSTRWCAARAS